MISLLQLLYIHSEILGDIVEQLVLALFDTDNYIGYQ